MSTMKEIDPVLVKDSTINDLQFPLKPEISVASKDNSFYSYSASSQNSNSVVVNCPIPSQSAIVDRQIYMSAQLNCRLIIDCTDNANREAYGKFNQTAMRYGQYWGPQSMPLNRLFSNVVAKINNMSINVSQDDCFDALYRLNNVQDLVKSSVYSPYLSDVLAEYPSKADIDNSIATNYPTQQFQYNQFASYDKNTNSPFTSRGSLPLYNLKFGKGATVNDGLTQVNGNAPITDVANFKIQANQAGDATVLQAYVINFSLKLFEPLLVSPFIFSSSKKKQRGLCGLDNITFNMTVDNTLKNVFSHVRVADLTNVDPKLIRFEFQSTPIQDFNIHMNILTPQPYQSLPLSTLCPIVNVNRYVSASTNNTVINSGANGLVQINNISFSSVPEKILILVRRPSSTVTPFTPQSYMSIESCSISFGNKQGILANTPKELLYKISRQNGLDMDWLGWNGNAFVNTSTPGLVYVASNLIKNISTCGGPLVLDPVNFGLDPYVSNNSAGNYNFSCQLRVTNNFLDPIVPEICIITLEGAFLKNTSGKTELIGTYVNQQLMSELVTKDVALSSNLANKDESQFNDMGALDNDYLPKGYGGGSEPDATGSGLSRIGGRMKRSSDKKLNKMLL
jgi:hypothetical protein